MRAAVAFLAVLSLAGSAGAQPAAAVSSSGTDATLDRAVAAYGRLKTARGTFEQTLTNPLTGNSAVQRGELQMQMPGKLALRFTDPKGDMIVSDGQVVWVYLPSSAPRQVLKTEMREGTIGSVDLAGQFFSQPRAKYNITAAGAATLGGRSTHALTLVPKTQAQAQFVKATVWIDDADGTLRQFEVTEASGLVRKVTLTKLSLNVPVDRKAFSFTPPKGVKVYDQNALSGR
ncbi:MAG TPA: outer membrane lipoprotein chaperone LolA [Gemmatimonadaceae bacterium]|nr:outer membrane lipoprotein chaperone LolA [Gemmatimonadaceae bacterium]